MNLTERTYDKLKGIVGAMSVVKPDATFYMNTAPKSATTPYIVFRVEDTIDTSPTYQTTIKFMCWDIRNTSSSTNIANADLIIETLNRKQFNYEDMGLHTTLTIQQSIPSEYLADKQCIELQFDTTIYERTQYYGD